MWTRHSLSLTEKCGRLMVQFQVHYRKEPSAVGAICRCARMRHTSSEVLGHPSFCPTSDRDEAFGSRLMFLSREFTARGTNEDALRRTWRRDPPTDASSSGEESATLCLFETAGKSATQDVHLPSLWPQDGQYTTIHRSTCRFFFFFSIPGTVCPG